MSTLTTSYLDIVERLPAGAHAPAAQTSGGTSTSTCSLRWTRFLAVA